MHYEHDSFAHCWRNAVCCDAQIRPHMQSVHPGDVEHRALNAGCCNTHLDGLTISCGKLGYQKHRRLKKKAYERVNALLLFCLMFCSYKFIITCFKHSKRVCKLFTHLYTLHILVESHHLQAKYLLSYYKFL